MKLQNYITVFQDNLEKSSDMCCQSGLVFDEPSTESNFAESVEKLELTVFKTPVESAEDFYFYLSNIPENQKEKLIRNFYTSKKYITDAFKTAGLPAELLYVAPAFSAMNRNATGDEGRAGVWQITHFQGILNGLTINRLVDERLNERLSIHSYVQEINQNREIFGSIELALLAQWYGKTKVHNAIVFADGKKSLDDLLPYFPSSAVEKIGAFQAIAMFFKSNKLFEGWGNYDQNSVPDTVDVFHQVHFKQISEVLNIPENELICMNPQYRFEIVPANKIPNKIALPEGFHDNFITMQDSVYSALDSTLFEITVQKIEYPPTPSRQYLGEPVKDLEIEGKTKIKYKLETGDVLGIIAEKYDVQVEDLKYWNNIVNERRIQAGKNIDIFVDDEQVDYYLKIDDTEKDVVAESNTFVEQLQRKNTLKLFEDLKGKPKLEYEVKSGESPYTIAKQFEGVSPDDILLWNNIDDARKIQVGQKLTIYLKE